MQVGNQPSDSTEDRARTPTDAQPTDAQPIGVQAADVPPGLPEDAPAAGPTASRESSQGPSGPPQAAAPGVVHADAPPVASGAALVPVLALTFHVIALWSAPHWPIVLERWLPWPIEALLAWLPWASVCLWAATLGGRGLPRARRLRDALVAGAAALCSLHYVLVFRFPSARERWSPERYLSELAAYFSTTWHGAPWRALLYSLGWTACAALIARVAAETSAAHELDSNLLRRGPGLFAVLVFLIGSSALLRYATGSPWPLFGTH